MSEFKEVSRKPPIAAKFEGGAASATPIIDWVLAQGGTAFWSEEIEGVDGNDKDPGRPTVPERIRILWDESASPGGKAIYIYTDCWVVYEDGDYSFYTNEEYKTIFEDPGTLREFVDRHMGDAAPHTYFSRELAVEAHQFPKPNKNEAAKDYEERVKQFAIFVDVEGAEVYEINVSPIGKAGIGVKHNGANRLLRPGDWAVSNMSHDLGFYNDASFRQYFKNPEEK